MKTEFEFCLPLGYMDDWGRTYRQGTMRRSRAMDEITPMKDPRVQENPAYATVVILARVITRIGDITEVTPEIIENLFASDLGYLQTLYRQINSVRGNAQESSDPASEENSVQDNNADSDELSQALAAELNKQPLNEQPLNEALRAEELAPV